MHCCFMCLSVLICFHDSLFLQFPCTVPTLFFHFSFTFHFSSVFLHFSFTFLYFSFTFLTLFFHHQLPFRFISFPLLFFHFHLSLVLHCFVTFLLLVLHSSFSILSLFLSQNNILDSITWCCSGPCRISSNHF